MSWEKYEKAAEAGPRQIAMKMIMLGFGLAIVIALIGWPLGLFSSVAQVAQEEFGPRAALEKYEWFKDAAAQLEKKQADIGVYEGRLKTMNETYAKLERHKWPREDREQFNLWSSEIAGVRASFNSLAAEYNAQMAKFNWRFANAGDLPKGASQPMAREFKQYVNQ